MTWGEFKAKVEALGVLDDTLVAAVDVDAVGRGADDEHKLRAIVNIPAATPGVYIMDDRAERRTLPGPGESLRL